MRGVQLGSIVLLLLVAGGSSQTVNIYVSTTGALTGGACSTATSAAGPNYCSNLRDAISLNLQDLTVNVLQGTYTFNANNNNFNIFSTWNPNPGATLRIIGAASSGATATTFDCQGNGGWANYGGTRNLTVAMSNLAVTGDCDFIVRANNVQSGSWSFSGVSFTGSNIQAITFPIGITSLTVSSSTISGNNGNAIRIGGLAQSFAISSSTFANNGGSAISVTRTQNTNTMAIGTIASSTFLSNGGGSNGGGILLSTVAAMISNCNFTTNDADLGGGLSAVNSIITAIANTYTGNTASNGLALGGAIYLSGSEFTSSGDSLQGNQADNGGAVYAETSDIRVTNCVVTGNSIAGTTGGAFYLDTVTGQIFGSSFTSNSATIPLVSLPNGGGALWITGLSTLLIQGCTFATNSAYVGGAIGTDRTANAAGTVVTLQGCTFTRNTAADAGGAIDLWLSVQLNALNNVFTGNSALQGGAIRIAALSDTPHSVTINNGSFSDNFATGSLPTHQGGAITTTEVLSLGDCVFKNNSAAGHGGAVSTVAALSITGTSFFLNRAGLSQATGSGGAIYAAVSAEPVTIFGSQFTQNSAYEGGAIWSGAPLTTSGTTLVSNSATASGGAVSLFNAGSADLTVDASNSAPLGSALFASGGSVYLQANSHIAGSIYLDASTALNVFGILQPSSANNNTCLYLGDNATVTINDGGKVALGAGCAASGNGDISASKGGIFGVSGGTASLRVPAILTDSSIFEIGLRSLTDFDVLTVSSPGVLFIDKGALFRANSENDYKPKKGHTFDVITAQTANFDLIVGKFADHLQSEGRSFGYDVKYKNHTATSSAAAYQTLSVKIHKGGLTGGQIAGIVIGSVFGAIILGGVIFFVYTKVIKKRGS